jgi:hypothetical protein
LARKSRIKIHKRISEKISERVSEEVGGGGVRENFAKKKN